jgi:hypothetical protein
MDLRHGNGLRGRQKTSTAEATQGGARDLRVQEPGPVASAGARVRKRRGKRREKRPGRLTGNVLIVIKERRLGMVNADPGAGILHRSLGMGIERGEVGRKPDWHRMPAVPDGTAKLFNLYEARGLRTLGIYHGEFDPGSERTLAACLKHASRAARGSNAP